MRKILLLIACILMLGGCYDYHELNDLEIVSSMIIDYKDDKYVVNVEFLDTSKDAKRGSHFLSGEGKNLKAAINNVFFDSTLLPFYSHMKTLIISENIARAGIDEFFDFLLRDTQFRKDFFVFVASDIDEFLDFETEKNESIGEMAKMSAKRNQEKNGHYKTSTFRELIYHYLRDNNYVLGSISIEDDVITLDDSYLFVDNKMNIKLEKGAVLLENLIYEGNQSFQIYGENNFEIHGYSLDRKIKKDKIVLTLKGHARLLDSQGKSSLDEKELVEIEKELNDKLEKFFEDVVSYSKKQDVDIFNFNYFYYLFYPKLVKPETWKDLEYEFKSDLNLSEKGLLLNSLGGIRNGK